ncbi:hypothetical protein NQ314_006634 [Rhamnusium bicolor]|uniref:PHD and RING finger domain-containing protein 1 n=1 Tax=Rhamnusium bicolor TaxID=1586634 RepID=A0AAV8YYL9_9CUCU|nr:hypothetical protein NQ314_006634 [Rhamnusium bicolor]
MSGGDDDSDAGPQHKRKRKVRRLEDSPASTSSDSSPIIGCSSRTRRRPFQEKIEFKTLQTPSSNTTASVKRVRSDTDSDNSGSTIVKRTKRTGRIESESDVDSDVSDRGFEGSSSSQWETDLSGPETEVFSKVKNEPTASKEIQENTDSDSSDGQSEKCPICLLSFKSQEIGVPESCDHMFCLECIQEWSKNMNTCPVDRQEYNLIFVRKSIDGKVVRQVPIEKPLPQNDVNIVEDPTFCEICGTSNNEDRMLLCDGCDLGFHLYCLTPPLENIPGGAWFCNDCSPDDVYNSEIELYEIQLLLDDAETVERPQGRLRNQSARLIPRTRQSERVRRQIANNRHQSSINNSQLEHLSTSSNLEDSLLVDVVSSSTSRPRRHKRAERPIVRPKTVKKRLAVQLGICAPRTVPQSLPDVKIQNNSSNTLGDMRYQAGIPTLHLFGQANELDYFSDGEDYLSGPQLLVRRAANQSDISATRSIARRKAVLAPAVSSSTDLLDSILSSQEQFHSRNASYSIDSSGNFKIERRNIQNNNYIDVNKQNISMRQRPNSYQNQNSENNPSFNSSNTNSYHSHSIDQYHSTPTSTMESASFSSFSGGSREPNEVPQDYTQRTLCASNEANTQGKRDKDEDNTGTNTPNSESEIDIYSDIETVSTSKVDEGDLRPPSPPIISNTPNTGTDDDNNDSEPDMVIDDEKVQELEKFQEETTVTSTVGFSSEFISTTVHFPAEVPHSSMEIQSGAIQSSNLMDNKNNEDDDDSTDGCPNTSIYSKESINVSKETDDIDSDDGCPNFSIYSKESKNVALHTDISLSAEDNTQTQDYQVGEISSSPIVSFQESYMPHSPMTRTDEMVNYSFDRRTGEDQMEGDKLETSAISDNTLQENNRENISQEDELSHPERDLSNTTQSEAAKKLIIGGILGGLYSDSEDETVVKKDNNSFAISDINHMTEDISEEERSYTPCLDERATKQGLEGLDTELISDEDRNDFDESHELKTVSDGDALEINAKESELDFTRPEDYEEGEIVDKNKDIQNQEEPEEKEQKKPKPKQKDAEDGKEDKKSKKKDKDKSISDHDKSGNKENEVHNKEASFKKLSKNTKERNYRDKDKETVRQRTPSRPPEDRDQNKKERKREKRKELERYNVRAIIAEKPRPQIIKDQFGRDVRRTPTRSRSRSYTPPIQTSPSRARRSPSKSRRSLSRHRSISRARKSVSKEKVVRKRRPRSRNRTLTRSRSRSPGKMRSKNKKRKRSSSRYDKRRKSRDRSKNKKKPRSRSRQRSRSVTSPRRKRGWNRREWTPLSMSRSPEPHHMSPSWTPPRVVDNSQTLRNENLTVLLNNSNKKKKDKRRKIDKRTNKESTSTDARQKNNKRRRDRDRTPPPSKEVFASGDNILVSVSFNNENEVRDVTTRDRRKKDTEDIRKKKRKNRNRRDLSGVKPVAIIDLERSPFKEITPSPKDVIVLSDSDNNDNETVNRNVQQSICDSSQQVASPERSINYSMGPKTPPEPQIKFSLSAKPPQVRAINNPLHEPDDIENNDVQEEINSRINEVLHKGPNTPPEPPNSPPSSPDAYDPFEPTKSRSPTPDPMQTAQSNISINIDDNNDNMESRSAIDLLEKSANQTPDVMKSLTPPIADVQPADSQSSIQATPESNIGKSPERIGVVINQTVQPSLSASKPVAQTTPFSSVPTSMITSTPVSSNLAPSRINILNSTIITPPHVASSIPQRIVLPNQVKSSPVKISPTKAAIKSTPIKPMPNKNSKSNTRKNRSQNAIGADDINLDFDSPYSPGSSDYEDLFEPPSENIVKSSKSTSKNNTKSSQKHQSTFDALFGSPNFHKNKNKNDKFKFGKKSITPTKTKTVGVKLDEDNLKILDDLPNSAVEMQVKDKFLKKLNRQERVVEEVKLVLKPHYNKKRISKEEYKDILRRSVPKICHNKSGEINPTKIKNLIEAYVKKIRHSKKVTSSSSVNPQKV